MQNRASSIEAYDRFVGRVLESREVWGLRSPEGGWAVSPSHEVEGRSVIVFWSDEAYAARHIKEEWRDYSPAAISLDDFIDSWLRGMHQDGVYVGPNWDAHLCGLECSAVDVAQKLTE